MASLTSSSRRSSSSYRSSSRYSTSSSYRSEGSLGGSSDCLDPLFEPFLDSAEHSSLFAEEGPGSCLTPFSRQTRSSYGLNGEGTDAKPAKLSVKCQVKSQMYHWFLKKIWYFWHKFDDLANVRQGLTQYDYDKRTISEIEVVGNSKQSNLIGCAVLSLLESTWKALNSDNSGPANYPQSRWQCI